MLSTDPNSRETRKEKEKERERDREELVYVDTSWQSAYRFPEEMRYSWETESRTSRKQKLIRAIAIHTPRPF